MPPTFTEALLDATEAYRLAAREFAKTHSVSLYTGDHDQSPRFVVSVDGLKDGDEERFAKWCELHSEWVLFDEITPSFMTSEFPYTRPA